MKGVVHRTEHRHWVHGEKIYFSQFFRFRLANVVFAKSKVVGTPFDLQLWDKPSALEQGFCIVFVFE